MAIKLTTKEAIEYVLDKFPERLNKSRLGKMLGITNQAINNYLKYDYKMSLTVADKMLDNFDVIVTDVKYMNRPLTPYELEHGILARPPKDED